MTQTIPPVADRMAEPEGLLIEGAHRVAVVGARDLWWRIRPPGEAPVLARWRRVRQRLELFLGAPCTAWSVSILPADPEPAPTWLAAPARPRRRATLAPAAEKALGHRPTGRHVVAASGMLDAQDG